MNAGVLCSSVALSFMLFAAFGAGEARADVAACSAAAEDGQRTRAAGKLASARRSFLSCSTAECPSVIQRDCAKWASEVLDATPTFVIDAQDAGGHDISDATVSIDGAPIQGGLDGKPIEIDPGGHTILVVRKDGSKMTETIIAKEGVKRRPVRLVFKGETTTTTTTQSSTPTTTTTQPDTSSASPASSSSGGHHTVFPWIVVGVGAAIMLSGLILIVTSPGVPAGCDVDTELCTPRPGDTPATLDQRRSQAGEAQGRSTYGALIIAGGGVVLLGGLIWHFLEPTGGNGAKAAKANAPSMPRVTPWFGTAGGGLFAQGQF